VLAITGTGDTVVSGDAQRPVLDLVTGVEHREIAGGHYLMHDRADLVAGLVEGFLRRQESRPRSPVA
jgi:pimeloyl-ACP methyl ester carboxylesterase